MASRRAARARLEIRTRRQGQFSQRGAHALAYGRIQIGQHLGQRSLAARTALVLNPAFDPVAIDDIGDAGRNGEQVQRHRDGQGDLQALDVYSSTSVSSTPSSVA